MKIPNFLKPAIGGALTGMIGFFLPHTLAFGYGYAQQALNHEATLTFLLSLAIGKMLTTSFSIGSGGSGGLLGWRSSGNLKQSPLQKRVDMTRSGARRGRWCLRDISRKQDGRRPP
jgi:hypothetical protein